MKTLSCASNIVKLWEGKEAGEDGQVVKWKDQTRKIFQEWAAKRWSLLFLAEQQQKVNLTSKVKFTYEPSNTQH